MKCSFAVSPPTTNIDVVCCCCCCVLPCPPHTVQSPYSTIPVSKTKTWSTVVKCWLRGPRCWKAKAVRGASISVTACLVCRASVQAFSLSLSSACVRIVNRSFVRVLVCSEQIVCAASSKPSVSNEGVPPLWCCSVPRGMIGFSLIEKLF